jgi:hypothetical protein
LTAKRKRKAGRPSLYTQERIERLCAAYSTGLSLADSAMVAKISVATAKAWVRESKANPKGPKGEFWPMMRGALARALMTAADDVKRSDPRWFLSRMRPKRFGDPTKRVDLNAKVDLSASFRHGQFEADIARILKLKPRREGGPEPVGDKLEDEVDDA